MRSERGQVAALLIGAVLILLAPLPIAVATVIVFAMVLELATAFWTSIMIRRPRVQRGRGVQLAVLAIILAIIIRSVVISRGLQ